MADVNVVDDDDVLARRFEEFRRSIVACLEVANRGRCVSIALPVFGGPPMSHHLLDEDDRSIYQHLINSIWDYFLPTQVPGEDMGEAILRAARRRDNVKVVSIIIENRNIGGVDAVNEFRLWEVQERLVRLVDVWEYVKDATAVPKNSMTNQNLVTYFLMQDHKGHLGWTGEMGKMAETAATLRLEGIREMKRKRLWPNHIQLKKMKKKRTTKRRIPKSLEGTKGLEPRKTLLEAKEPKDQKARSRSKKPKVAPLPENEHKDAEEVDLFQQAKEIRVLPVISTTVKVLLQRARVVRIKLALGKSVVTSIP
jgi:hypothetical protein